MATVDEEVKLTQADLDSIRTNETNDLSASNKMFDDMYKNVQDTHTETTDAISKNRAEQEKIVNQQTDFAIDQIEQQKAQLRKDTTKEMAAADMDYRRAVDPYGANAEKMASQGLAGSGYEESSKVRMYVAYQNRVASARESYQLAVQNYNNAMTEAKLQNSSLLAQIAAEALEKQLEADLTFLQMGQSILTQKADAAYKIKQTAQSNWMDMYKAIESRRQYDETMAFNREQFEWQKEQDRKEAGISKTTKYTSSQIKARNANRENSRNSSNSAEVNNGTSLSAADKDKLSEKAKNIWGYVDAKDFLKENGIPALENRLLTSQEWNKAKRTGEQGSELAYPSYVSYIRNYLICAIDEAAK